MSGHELFTDIGNRDVVVVGKGLFGVAAARHLAQAGARVVLVGPGEPVRYADHDGVFSSHYDESRIVRTTARDLTWARLTQRSIAAFQQLERETGIHFYHRRPGMHLVDQWHSSAFLDVVEGLLPALQTPVTMLDDPRSIREQLPLLKVRPGARGFVERGDAGFIEPRKLIQAQVSAFVAVGGQVIDDIVERIEHRPSGLLVSTRSGLCLTANQVLVATGAYTNSAGLLPEPLNLRVKCEHVLVARLEGLDAHAAAAFPTLVYEGAIGALSDFYLTPPLRTPDGAWEIKMGCNTAQDRFLRDTVEINAWMRADMDPHIKQQMHEVLQGLLPSLRLVASKARKCIVTYTPKTLPMIGPVADGLFVVTGGNGMGAKASDAIGELAARALWGNAWQSPLYQAGMLPELRASAASDDRAFSLRGMTRSVGN
jgi:sarcosine oxidase